MTSHPEIAGARCECLACRIERLEVELTQTKRNMTHVEDCWGNIQSALGETESELAEANATIARVVKVLAFLDPGQFDHTLAERDGGYSWGFHKASYGAVSDIRRALEAAPKPTEKMDAE